MVQQQFTKYEIARILGARALQIAMDAPVLLKIPESELKEMKYDPIKIAEKEFSESVLPIVISRPIPRRGKDRLSAVKEEKITDEELAEKEKEVEKEITQDAEQLGFVNAGEEEELGESQPETGEEQ